MRRIAVYFAATNRRSRLIAHAMHKGIRRYEAQVELLPDHRYRQPRHDIAIFYGLAGNLRRVFHEYRAEGRKAVYIDLGYWGRRNKNRYDGYHKLSLNGRHPTDYFQAVPHPADRFEHFGIDIAPWRQSGRHIIVAGMSAKGATCEGFVPQQWEGQTITALRRLTDRPIVYRPKPSWIGAKPIAGSTFQPGIALVDALDNAWAVVCHHSNIAIDAILAGVPVVCTQGVATKIASGDLSCIESLPMPDNRAQWAADIAYAQWSMDEMESGAAWLHLAEEVLC